MAGSSANDKWDASIVTNNDIEELKRAGYLLANITHWAPKEGQVLPHFIRGLGFPLHPFVRGLMFFYGLDFHDLAPNSLLHI